MENRFAGAQNQSERRRRRLATDEPEARQDSVSAPGFVADDILPAVPRVTPVTLASLSLVGRVVARQVWKHVIFLGAVACLLGGLLNAEPQQVSHLAPHGIPPLLYSVSGLLLLFAGQLAFIIGWVREESEIDFRGRYRWWRWLACSVTGLALLLVTHTFAHVPDVLEAALEPVTGKINAARQALVVVPCLAVGSVVLSRTLPDMSRCVCSQSLFVLSMLTLVVRQMLILNNSDASIQQATLDTMMVAGVYLLFASMLIHCWFVTYICNDPPAAALKSSTRTKAVSDTSGEESTATPSEPPINGESESAESKPDDDRGTPVSDADAEQKTQEPAKKSNSRRKRRKARTAARKAA